MEGKHPRFLLGLLYAILAAGALWLLLPWLLPFLLALGVAALLDRPVGWLMDHLRLSRTLAAALCVVLLVALLGGLVVLVVYRGCYEVGVLFTQLPVLLGLLPDWQQGLERWIYRMVVAAPVAVQSFLRETASGLIAQGITVPSALYTWLLDLVSGATAALPSIMLFSFTTVLATYFSAAYRPLLLAFFRRQLPTAWLGKLRLISARLGAALGGWLKAQGILLLITFFLLALGLLLLGVDLALLIAGGTALLDALPVFGTGVVLLPWAAFSFLTGQPGRGVGLVAIYALLSLSRSLLEPKMVGDRVGLHPLAALFFMYGGFHFFGVFGMIFAPLVAIMAKQLHDCGVWRLWRD